MAKQKLEEASEVEALMKEDETFEAVARHKPASHKCRPRLKAGATPGKRALNRDMLHPWQKELEDKSNEEPDDRKMIFAVDHAGGAGETTFLKCWHENHPHDTQIPMPLKKNDLAHAAKKATKCFLFNCTRDDTFTSCNFSEQLDKRHFFTVKSPNNKGRMQQRLP